MKTTKDILEEMRNLAQGYKDADDVTPRRHIGIALERYANAIEQAVTKCNQLKMREALKCIDNIAKYLEGGTIRDVQHAYRNIQDRVRIALSTPPRNCDLYPKDEVRLAYHLHGDGLMTMQAFADWLYAEAKGE